MNGLLLSLMKGHFYTYGLFKREHLIKKFKNEIAQSRDALLSALAETEYFHGTGAYQYSFDGTKYDGNLKGIKYTLEKILTEGLLPQRDYFNEIMQTGVDHTVSLSKNHPYARCYADLFNFEKEQKGYRLGSPYFWSLIITSAMMKHELSNISKEKRREIREKRKTDEYHKRKEKIINNNMTMLNGWTRSFRKDGKYEGRNFIFSVNDGSDIVGNFGVVIGIKKNVVTPLPNKYTGIKLYETRTDKNIPPPVYSHIQVPLKNIGQVSTEFKRLNLDIPLFPIEFIELLNYQNKNYGLIHS